MGEFNNSGVNYPQQLSSASRARKLHPDGELVCGRRMGGASRGQGYSGLGPLSPASAGAKRSKSYANGVIVGIQSK